MAGSFWFRSSGPTEGASVKTAVAKTDKQADGSSTSNLMIYQKNGTSGYPRTIVVGDVDPANSADTGYTKNDETIQVANLPSVNGKLAVAKIEKPSGSALAYDDIKDKSILYLDGTERYGTKDIKSTIDTNRASLLAYGLALAKIIRDYPFYPGKTPTEITFEMYQDKKTDSNALISLESVRFVYKEKVNELLKISIPKDLVKGHLALANSFDRISQLTANMQKVGEDRLFALNSARQYVEESKFVLTILNQLNSNFNDKNIDLGKDEKVELKIDVIN